MRISDWSSDVCSSDLVAAAPDELLRLGEELDLADAAAAELQVVARHRDAAAAAVRVDLALDRMDVADRLEIQAAAPDEGPEMGEESFAGVDVPGHRARLQHGRAFPVLAHALVIGFGGTCRHRQRRGGRLRPEPEFGAEDVAARRPLAE